MTKIAEFYGLPVVISSPGDWAAVVGAQTCPFLNRRCLKSRKSDSSQTIGTCTLLHGQSRRPVMICPHRLLDRRQIFLDCLHLLTRHEPGNELHLVSELSVPGGSVDYCLASVRNAKVVDFTGIELQTLDTTGSAWPERQQFLRSAGVKVKTATSDGGFGMNWKMTAKTALVQLHHKVDTFEHIGRHLVLVLQDHLMDYMRQEFSFDHLSPSKLGDPQHFHCYQLIPHQQTYRLQLKERWSTDATGIAKCLDPKTQARVELDQIVRQIEAKVSAVSRFQLDPTASIPATGNEQSGS
jgi:hypothetical protein